MVNAALADPRGQMRLPAAVAGVPLSEGFNSTLEMETTSPWLEPRRLEGIESGVAPRQQKRTGRAAVAVPGSQAPGVAIYGVALRLHSKLQDNQGASASGSSRQRVLLEVSTGQT